MVKINYSNTLGKSLGYNIIFINKNTDFKKLNNKYNYLDKSVFNDIKKNNSVNFFVQIQKNGKYSILVYLENNLLNSDIENLGAEFYNFIKKQNIKNVIINLNDQNFVLKKNLLIFLFMGLN